MQIDAIIPAGGIGKRMKSQKPKQFLTLNNEPILLITLKALAETGLIRRFIIPTIDIVYTKKIIKAAMPDINLIICKSGKLRQESIYNALDEIKASGEMPDMVLIHDAVRALVRKNTVERVIEKAKTTGAAISGRPVTDTLKLAQSNEAGETTIKKNVSRDSMWISQTPQVFKTDMLIEAYEKAKQDHFTGTDSAGLVERLGKEVHIVEGRPSNIKITTPEDLELANLYIELFKL